MTISVTPLGQELAHGQGQLCGRATLFVPSPAQCTPPGGGHDVAVIYVGRRADEHGAGVRCAVPPLLRAEAPLLNVT